MGDTVIDGVKSLCIEVASRQSFAKVTMEFMRADIDLVMNAEVVRHGEFPPAAEKMPPNCTTCGVPLGGAATRFGNHQWLCSDCLVSARAKLTPEELEYGRELAKRC